jgi:PAS domain S-box-containing protein/putative nucleotidyltransferase with HDIG domain
MKKTVSKNKKKTPKNRIKSKTEPRSAIDFLKNPMEFYEKLLITTGDAIEITDLDGNIIYASEHAAALFGVEDSKLLKWKSSIVFIAPECREKALLNLKRVIKEGFLSRMEYTMLRSDGSRFTAEINSSIIMGENSMPAAVLNTMHDVSKSRLTEGMLKKTEENYRAIFNAVNDGIIIVDPETGDIVDANKKAYEIKGCSFEMLKERGLRLFISPKDDTAIEDVLLKNRGQLKHDDVHVFECSDRVAGVEQWVEVSLKKDVISGKQYLIAVVRDITKKKKMEDDLNQSFNAVKKVMDGIINAMEKLVEKKDLYTVGHQHRTAQLARAIAGQMGLPGEQINCVYISALIHDIGKIFVSGSILNKAGPLTKEEYEIIKQHPEAGYEVLKTIDFPWPIADIILQHHERLDGSGYPYGLKDERIYLESRIISVADVVEAITFARPYRPAFGIDKALEEISANRGRLYDAEVVDITVSLMKEQGFKFE